jgi:hypothetical protein
VPEQWDTLVAGQERWLSNSASFIPSFSQKDPVDLSKVVMSKDASPYLGAFVKAISSVNALHRHWDAVYAVHVTSINTSAEQFARSLWHGV